MSIDLNLDNQIKRIATQATGLGLQEQVQEVSQTLLAELKDAMALLGLRPSEDLGQLSKDRLFKTARDAIEQSTGSFHKKALNQVKTMWGLILFCHLVASQKNSSEGVKSVADMLDELAKLEGRDSYYTMEELAQFLENGVPVEVLVAAMQKVLKEGGKLITLLRGNGYFYQPEEGMSAPVLAGNKTAQMITSWQWQLFGNKQVNINDIMNQAEWTDEELAEVESDRKESDEQAQDVNKNKETFNYMVNKRIDLRQEDGKFTDMLAAKNSGSRSPDWDGLQRDLTEQIIKRLNREPASA
jgi:hypothetical protein